MSHLITEPKQFAEVTILPADVKKSRLKSTLKEIKKSINKQTFIMDDTYKGDPVTPCMDVYKTNIQSDRSLGNLKLEIVVR